MVENYKVHDPVPNLYSNAAAFRGPEITVCRLCATSIRSMAIFHILCNEIQGAQLQFCIYFVILCYHVILHDSFPWSQLLLYSIYTGHAV